MTNKLNELYPDADEDSPVGLIIGMGKLADDIVSDGEDFINRYVEQTPRKLTDGRTKCDGLVSDYQETSFDEYHDDLPKDNGA